MLRRRPALPALLAAALIAALPMARPGASRAAAVTSSYELINNSGTTLTDVEADVLPPGTIATGQQSSSPLTILPNSQGFDQSHLTVALADGQVDGHNAQRLVLLFGITPTFDSTGKISGFNPILGADGKPVQGLAPGGVLNFSLNVADGFQNITLNAPPAGLSLVPMTTAPPSNDQGSGAIATSTSTATGGNQVPEPLTLVIWSTGVVGLGLIRARAYRRSHRLPA